MNKDKASIHNRFYIEVIDSKTGKVREEAEAFNVITNNWWTSVPRGGYSGRYIFGFIEIGSGTGTPSESDTSLFNFQKRIHVGYGQGTVEHNKRDGVISFTKSVQIIPSDLVGVNITEVGIASAEYSSVYDDSRVALVTHAMLKDMNGNPISIQKTDTDIINIYATVFYHYKPDTFDGIQVISDSLNSYSPLFIGLFHDARPGTLRVCKGTGVARVADIGSKSFDYDSTTRTTTIEFNRIEASNTSVNDLKGFCYGWYMNSNGTGGGGGILYKFPGSRITNEAVGTGDGTTTDFNTKFDFPSNATIKVNGVEMTSGVSIYNGLTSTSEYYRDYFMPIDENLSTENDIRFLRPGHINDWSSSTGKAWNVEYNPFYNNGIYSYKYRNESRYTGHELYLSNDLVNWVPLPIASDGVERVVPEQYRNYKFIKYGLNYYGGRSDLQFFDKPDRSSKNIHFDVAPENGSVITITYDTPLVNKDTMHVFDFKTSLTWNNYVNQ